MTALLAALLGGCAGFGLLVTAAGLRGQQPSQRHPGALRRVAIATTLPSNIWLRLLLGTVGFVPVLWFTGWVVGGLVAAVAAASAPSFLAAKGERDRAVAKMEAIAAWTEMVRDAISAAAGLEEALRSTAALAPPPIREEVRRLVTRAERQSLVEALREFAAETEHALTDMVTVAFVQAARGQAGSLVSTLSAVADGARQEVSMRLRIEAARARQYTAARLVAGVVTLVVCGMLLLNRQYLEPFDAAFGQVMLAVVGGLFIGAGMALVRMSRFQPAPRVLAHPTTAGPQP